MFGVFRPTQEFFTISCVVFFFWIKDCPIKVSSIVFDYICLLPFYLDQEILCQLEKEKILVFTPARRIGGKRVVCYDDRYILNLAVDSGGIVVSNDNYRDLVSEKPEYRKVIEERLLMYSFVNDRYHIFQIDFF